MWAKAAASAVVGYGFGTLIALALLWGEGGPDLTLVGPGFVRALAAIGAAAVLVGVVAGWGAVRATGRGPRALRLWACGVGIASGLFVVPVLVFFQAGNVTDATGGTSPGSSWGILVLILGGLLVGLVASLGLVCRAVLDHQARVAAQ